MTAAFSGEVRGQGSGTAAPGDLAAIVINITPHQIVGHPFVGQASLLLLDETGTLLTNYNLAANPITLTCSVGQLTPDLIADSTLFVGGVINLNGLQISYQGPSGATAITASSTGVSSSAVLVSFSGYDILSITGLSADTVSRIYSNIATDLSVVTGNGGDQTAVEDPGVKAFFKSGGGSISVFFDPKANGRQDTVSVELPTSGLSVGADTLLLVLESAYRPNGQLVRVYDTVSIPLMVQSGQGLQIVSGSLEPDSAYAGIPFGVSFLVITDGIQQPWDRADFELTMVTESDSVLAIVYSGPVVNTDIRQDTLIYGGVQVQIPPVFPPGTYRTRAQYSLLAGGLRFRSQLPYVGTMTVLAAPSLTYQTGTLAPSTVIAEEEWSFHFDVLLDGNDPVQISAADSYFELRSGDFSSTVGLQVTGNILYPGMNRIFTRRLFVPSDLVDQSLEAAASLLYYHAGSANRLSFSTDFEGRTIYVEAPPIIQVVEVVAVAPNTPFVNTGQALHLRCRVANQSPTAMTQFDLRLVSDGASTFDTIATIESIPGHDTVEVSFNVTAASEPTPAEIFRVDIATLGVNRLTPVDNIAMVTIQRPAELSVSLILRGADEGFVEVGAGFDLLLGMVNTGEAGATVGTFHISTNGMDLGLPGGATEIQESVAVGEVRGISFTAPPLDTVINLDIALTQRPIDVNTNLPAIIGDTVFQVVLPVTSEDLRLMVEKVETPSNVILRQSARDLMVFRVTNPAHSSLSDIRLLSMKIDLIDRDGKPLSVRSVLRLDSTRMVVDGVPVAHASAVANHLNLTFDDFVVPAGDAIDLALYTTVIDVHDSEFSLSLQTADIAAVYASGPRQGTTVAVATDNASGLVADEVFTLVDKSLAGSFVVRTNPFDPLSEPAEFRYFLAKAQNVTFVVLSLTGEQVFRRTLAAGEQGSALGENVLFWDGRNDNGDVVVNGVYLAILSLDDDQDRATIKLAVIK